MLCTALLGMEVLSISDILNYACVWLNLGLNNATASSGFEACDCLLPLSLTPLMAVLSWGPGIFGTSDKESL